MLESEDGWYHIGTQMRENSATTTTRDQQPCQPLPVAVGTRGGTWLRNKGSLEGTFSLLRLRSGIKVS